MKIDNSVTNEILVQYGCVVKSFAKKRVVFAFMNDFVAEQWYSIPEVAQALGVQQRDIRAMLHNQELLALRRGPNNALLVPCEFLLAEGTETVLVKGIRGTLIALADQGFSDEEKYEWLFAENLELGSTPITALRTGNLHAVRRAITTII